VARIRAILVGVDVYERSDVPPLNGCVNDVALVRRIMKQCFAIPNEGIRVLVNQRATKANIMHRLRQAVRDSEEGDVIAFYFSGHGSQLRDRDGDELTDALDEVICPYDMDWDRGTYILDDDLDAVFAQTPPGVLLEAFFDCCFWGAGARELGAAPRPEALRVDVRYLRPPLDIAARAEGEEEELNYHSFQGSGSFRGQNVLWAASREGQAAAEDYVEGRGQGVFTYAGCRFIEANAERILMRGYSRLDLLEDLRAYMSSLGFVQSAELTAPRPLRRVGLFMRDDGSETPVGAGTSRSAWTRRPPLR
jgi:metacaspase-1